MNKLKNSMKMYFKSLNVAENHNKQFNGRDDEYFESFQSS